MDHLQLLLKEVLGFVLHIACMVTNYMPIKDKHVHWTPTFEVSYGSLPDWHNLIPLFLAAHTKHSCNGDKHQTKGDSLLRVFVSQCDL